MSLRIIIVGGGAAGASAAARARRWSSEAEIHLFEAGNMITHAPCGIPYFVEGLVDDVNRLKTYSPEQFADERRIRVHVSSEVSKIDTSRREVLVRENGVERSYSWDRLVIATGAKPVRPRIEGIDLRGIYTARLPPDAEAIRRAVESARSVAIVGGGYIGLEMAEAVRRLGKKTLLFEALSHVLPTTLDEDTAAIVQEELRSNGVELHLSEPVKSFEGRNDTLRRVITELGEYEADVAIVAVGVRPDVSLAVEAGVKLGQTGAIDVNEYMETNIPDIYAAGDNAETTSLVTGKKTWIPLAPSANKMGQVAGANAVKPRSLRFPGIVGTAVTKTFGLFIAMTGLTESQAVREGIDVESALVKTRSTAGYYPGGHRAYVKLVMERGSGRIIGGQLLSGDKIIAGYIDALAVAISSRATIEDLFFADLSYAPPVAPVWHPLITAARVLSHGRF